MTEAGTDIVQARMLRLLQMIILLTKNPYTIREMALRLDTTERTVYRYMLIIKELGFEVSITRKLRTGKYKIEAWPKELLEVKI